jgi:hypothetical protein
MSFVIKRRDIVPLLAWLSDNGDTLLVQMDETHVLMELRDQISVVIVEIDAETCTASSGPRHPRWAPPPEAWRARIHELPLKLLRVITSGEGEELEVVLPCETNPNRFVFRRLAQGEEIGAVEVCATDTALEWYDEGTDTTSRFSATFHTRELLQEVDRVGRVGVDSVEFRRGEASNTVVVGGTSNGGTTVADIWSTYVAAADMDEFNGVVAAAATEVDEDADERKATKKRAAPAASSSSAPTRRRTCQLVLDLVYHDDTFETVYASTPRLKKFLACASFANNVSIAVVQSNTNRDIELIRLTCNVATAPDIMISVMLAPKMAPDEVQ